MRHLHCCFSLFISTLALYNLICKDRCNYYLNADDPVSLLPSSRPFSVQTKILFLSLNETIQYENIFPPSSLPLHLLSLQPHHFACPHKVHVYDLDLSRSSHLG